MLNNNILALLLTFVLSVAWLRTVDFLAHRGWVESRLSRKIIHIGTGPIFVFCWLLFQNTPAARFLAATVPLLITIQFLLIGIGVIKDEASVKAMSRTGDKREILYGPFFYGIIFVLLTIIYWFESPIGIIALMILCGGDGLAEILGRRFGKSRLPWARTKSWMGSLGMFGGGWSFSMIVIAVFISQNYFSGTIQSYLLPITVINLAATIIESLPIKDIDNLTITAISVVIGHFYF
ncbi:MAG: phosphatidate cytidylyltransferase [Aliifodinibius sp.]|nr:phosphatidate cytidylyltransferase [Fodinibius sp.]